MNIEFYCIVIQHESFLKYYPAIWIKKGDVYIFSIW